MKKSKSNSNRKYETLIRRKERKFILAFFIFFFVFLLGISWWFNALKVDFNSIAYESELSFAADMGRSLGEHGDSMYFRRLEMQRADFWALRLAAQISWLARVAISLLFAVGTYFSSLHCLRTFNSLFRSVKVNRRKG